MNIRRSVELMHKRHTWYGQYCSRGVSVVSVVIATLVATASVGGATEWNQDRPYLMPSSERARIERIVTSEDWARKDLDRVRVLARNDGYWAALLYALEGGKTHLATAKKWLLQYGRSGGDLGKRALKANEKFFRQGQPWLGDVYYRIDHRPLIAYDWIYSGLEPEERDVITSGILASARFRMNAMERWTQTPNLMFKPTFMAAIAGLVTDDQDLIEWGFNRDPGSGQGGYFSVLDAMLKDGGPWAEAPIYAVQHKSLLLMLRMSRLLQLSDGIDWFRRKAPSGGSPKGLLQYYIDTAYPIERTGFGRGRIRVATYGDGATGAAGDLFLVDPSGVNSNMHEELAEAYNLSGEEKYASFLSFVPDYRPTFFDRPALPALVKLPRAPSRIWPSFGVAMLRSDESSTYWTNEQSIAVLQRMTQAYGHGHQDQFAITLHGAGRLLYPDYNYIQYENPSFGWTRNSVAHNTVIVDGQDSKGVKPTAIRHDFTPEVKFLATSASGVFTDVDQMRSLMLTSEYLLDFFHVRGKTAQTYDYLLHSFGRPVPVMPESFEKTSGLGGRYSVIRDQKTAETDRTWSLDLVLDGEALRNKERVEASAAGKQERQAVKTQYGEQWYEHTAAVRVTMAGASKTRVTHGRGPDGLTVLIARRANVDDSVFVTAHEPFVEKNQPHVTGVYQLERTKLATVVRVNGKDFSDYGAVGLGPEAEGKLHVLADKADKRTSFAFKNYGYLRVNADGSIKARGEWISFSIPHARGPVMLNGKAVEARLEGRYLVYGSLPRDPDPRVQVTQPSPVAVTPVPGILRMHPNGRRKVSFDLANPLGGPISGELRFKLPEGISVEPASLSFGPIPTNKSERISATFFSDSSAVGPHTIPYRVAYKGEGQKKLTLAQADSLKLTVGPVLESIYPEPPNPAEYRISSPRYIAKADMFAGLFRYLADDDGNVRLDGEPLFTFTDGNKPLLFEDTKHAFTWPVESPAQLTAHAYDRCRWQALFFGDRIMVRMDRDWTQFKDTYFTVPGKWLSAYGSPNWRTVLTSGGALARPPTFGSTHTVKAAELDFRGANWNICFDFVPAQPVTFNATELKFSIRSLKNDQWTVGFCRPGTLEAWRWK